MTPAPAPDLDAQRSWIGRQESVEDAMPTYPAAAMTATLDRADLSGPAAALQRLTGWTAPRVGMIRATRRAEDAAGLAAIEATAELDA